MIDVKAIRNDEDLETALNRINEIFNAPPGTAEEEELEILTTLVEHYEAKHHAIPGPDPISAIKFRMDQENLTAADLAPMIGSRPRVYEILAGRRPITIEMARALHANLGIPAEVLLAQPKMPAAEELTDKEYLKFPITAMVKAGWIERPEPGRRKDAIDHLINRAGMSQKATALLRQGNTARLSAKTDQYALQAWLWQVAGTARENEPEGAYSPEEVSGELLKEVGRLSRFTDGPARAKKLLDEYGIAMVYTPHLPKTYLDGGAFMSPDDYPIVALTIRHDRVDNFWFTLLHELAHVSLHLGDEGNGDAFLDDLSLRNSVNAQPNTPKEEEADIFAQDSLIPPDRWEELQESEAISVNQVIALAQDLNISPAIVAGRIRHESGNYKLLSQFAGNGEVRKHLAHNR